MMLNLKIRAAQVLESSSMWLHYLYPLLNRGKSHMKRSSNHNKDSLNNKALDNISNSTSSSRTRTTRTPLTQRPQPSKSYSSHWHTLTTTMTTTLTIIKNCPPPRPHLPHPLAYLKSARSSQTSRRNSWTTSGYRTTKKRRSPCSCRV